MIHSTTIRGQAVQVHAEYEPACGDGWTSPRYVAGYVIDDCRDAEGRVVQLTEAEEATILFELEGSDEQHS